MEYSLDMLDPLISILECEASGQPVDRERGRLLAQQLKEACPEISGSVDQIITRMVASWDSSQRQETSDGRY